MTGDLLSDTLAEIRDRVACVASDLEALADALDNPDLTGGATTGFVAAELRRKAQELAGERRCHRCGKTPPDGFALIGGDSYCHGETSPTCYEIGQP